MRCWQPPLAVVGDGCPGNGVGGEGRECGQEGGTSSTNELTICLAVPLAERLSHSKPDFSLYKMRLVLPYCNGLCKSNELLRSPV